MARLATVGRCCAKYAKPSVGCRIISVSKNRFLGPVMLASMSSAHRFAGILLLYDPASEILLEILPSLSAALFFLLHSPPFLLLFASLDLDLAPNGVSIGPGIGRSTRSQSFSLRNVPKYPWTACLAATYELDNGPGIFPSTLDVTTTWPRRRSDHPFRSSTHRHNRTGPWKFTSIKSRVIS